jgi:hypothetical protein
MRSDACREQGAPLMPNCGHQWPFSELFPAFVHQCTRAVMRSAIPPTAPSDRVRAARLQLVDLSVRTMAESIRRRGFNHEETVKIGFVFPDQIGPVSTFLLMHQVVTSCQSWLRSCKFIIEQSNHGTGRRARKQRGMQRTLRSTSALGYLPHRAIRPLPCPSVLSVVQGVSQISLASRRRVSP